MIAVAAIIFPGVHFFCNARKNMVPLIPGVGDIGGSRGGASRSGAFKRNLRSPASAERRAEKEQDEGKRSAQKHGNSRHHPRNPSRWLAQRGAGGNDGATPRTASEPAKASGSVNSHKDQELINGWKGSRRRFFDVLHSAAEFFGSQHPFDDKWVHTSAVVDAATAAADAAVEAADAVVAAADTN